MNKGDYVRTKLGDISKIVFIQKEGLFIELEDEVLRNDEAKSYILLETEDDIKKTSSRIFDLLQKEDYVNGYKVMGVCDDYVIVAAEEEYDSFIKIKEKDIKIILTKEQMKRMSYKVGE